MSFDVAAYKRAVEAKDVEAWLAFYSDDAEWLEWTWGRAGASSSTAGWSCATG